MVEPVLNVSIEAGGLRAVYGRRLGERTRALEKWTRWDHRVADARLVVFVSALIAAYLVYQGGGKGGWWLAAMGGLFVGLVLSHEPISRAADRARRAVGFYSKGLARLDGQWAGTGIEGLEYLDFEHPYAADLDLFGKGSMFERLCTARTKGGEAMLASWLLAPASREEIHERHEAIDELRPRLDLREDLELLGAEVRAGLDPVGADRLVCRPEGLSWPCTRRGRGHPGRTRDRLADRLVVLRGLVAAHAASSSR